MDTHALEAALHSGIDLILKTDSRLPEDLIRRLRQYAHDCLAWDNMKAWHKKMRAMFPSKNAAEFALQLLLHRIAAEEPTIAFRLLETLRLQTKTFMETSLDRYYPREVNPAKFRVCMRRMARHVRRHVSDEPAEVRDLWNAILAEAEVRIPAANDLPWIGLRELMLRVYKRMPKEETCADVATFMETVKALGTDALLPPRPPEAPMAAKPSEPPEERERRLTEERIRQESRERAAVLETAARLGCADEVRLLLEAGRSSDVPAVLTRAETRRARQTETNALRARWNALPPIRRAGSTDQALLPRLEAALDAKPRDFRRASYALERFLDEAERT